jgi:peptide/nickel transport system ATP-binding protein
VTGAASVLTVENLTVALPPGADRPFALEGLTLDLRPAEILCVVGESGSGKSVLTSALMGALPQGLIRRSGRLALGEEDLCALSATGWRRVRGRRIALVPQEPMAALNPVARVGRQIEEVFAIHHQGDRAWRRGQALALLGQMRLDDPERVAAAYPHQLSGGQCQRVCIAMALALNPDVLIADEPTTALDVTTQAQVLRLIRAVRDEHGQAVLFVTHDLGVVADIADRIAVMRQGRLLEIGPAQTVLRSPGHPYTRALIAAAPSFARPRTVRPPADPPPCVLSVDGLEKTFGSRRALGPTRLALARGETLGVVGESGSGKSTLARLLVRLIAPSAGAVRVNGTDLAELSGRRLRRARRSVQMIFQDPFGSLNPKRRIGPMIARAAVLAGETRAGGRRRAEALLDEVGLGSGCYDRRPSDFSGGQRQRIGIARALALRPDVLIADESVSALDMSVQAQILALLEDIQTRLGLSIVFITHDLRVAAQVSDRIAVMKSGEIVEIGPAASVLTAPRHPYTQALLAAAPGQDRA